MKRNFGKEQFKQQIKRKCQIKTEINNGCIVLKKTTKMAKE